MDSYMFIPVICVLYFSAADGEEVVRGPAFLVTNGASELHLTCEVPDPSSVDRYAWFTPTPATKRCETSSAQCMFTPTLEDDNKNVTCRALDAKANTLAAASYTVNLKYPPQVSPDITQTDEIKCTVSGGKPHVMNVTFYCQNSMFPDEEDRISNETSTVISPITVDISTDVTAANLNCTCFAYWAPEPGLYPHISNEIVDLKEFLQARSTASWVGAGAVVFVAAITSIYATKGC